MPSMWRKDATIAKITLPVPAGDVLPRPRLYAQLNQASYGIWIGSPAATGKTTLAAAALRARGGPVLWYQVDGGDTDPGTFFFFLARAAESLGVSRRHVSKLKQFGPEVGDHHDNFARVWFRELVALLPTGTILVLDDWHLLPERNPLHCVLAKLLEELAPDIQLWILSRTAPPPELASARILGRLLTLNFTDLALTAAETSELVVQRLCSADGHDEQRAQRWHQWCEGWIGALVYALSAGRIEPTSLPPAIDTMTSETVFGFLATQLYERADSNLREFMLMTAWAPHIAEAWAGMLYPQDRLADQIESLLTQNLVLTVSGGRSWRYHRLLREFLQHRARKVWSPDEFRQRLTRIANCLSMSDMPEAAAQLLVRAENWPELADLLLRQAPRLLQTGRYATVESWAETLPSAQRSPWVYFWLASAVLVRDARAAFLHYDRAYTGFLDSGDSEGLYRSWCGAIEAITFACDDYGMLEQWLSRLRDLRVRNTRYPSLKIRALVIVYGFSATFFLNPNAPEFPRWRRGVQRLYHLSPRRADRAAIGGLLGLYHASITGMAGLGAHLHSLRSLINDPSVPPYVRLIGGLSDVIHHWVAGSSDAALERLDAYTRLAAESGAHAIDGQFAFQYVYVHCVRGELEAADGYLERIAGGLSSLGQIDVAQYHFLCGWRAALAERHEEAVQLLEVAAEHSRRRRFVLLESVSRGLLAEELANAGHHERARCHSACAMDLARQINSTTAQVACGIQAAAVLERSAADSEEYLRALAAAFGFARQHGHWAYGGLYPPNLARLCHRALDADIEVDYTLELIRRHCLLPTSAAILCRRWPWPLRIHTFGGLRILRDGHEIDFNGKAQRRPLELLMSLIALGGRRVATIDVIDWLWPGSDGDAGQRALITNLQRLRELLGSKAAVSHSGGRISIDAKTCWIDVWALDLSLDSDDVRSGDYLYEGAFLAGETFPWLIAPRERYQRRFVTALITAAQASRHSGDWLAAEQLFERAIRVDDCRSRRIKDSSSCS